MQDGEDDIVSLSSTQHQRIEEYISVHYDRNDISWGIKFLLMISDHKTGTLISPEPWEEDLLSGTCTDFFDVLDLHYTRVGGASQWYVSRDSDRIETLPTDFDGQKTRHRVLGNFFGYPDEVIEHFINTKTSDRKPPQEFVSENIFEPEEIAWSEFVFYMPIDTVFGYRQAIHDGKQNRDQLLKLASRLDIPTIKSLAEKRYQHAIQIMSKNV